MISPSISPVLCCVVLCCVIYLFIYLFMCLFHFYRNKVGTPNRKNRVLGHDSFDVQVSQKLSILTPST